MITNERQYKITKVQLKRLQHALEELTARDASDALVALSMEALNSEIEVLHSQLYEYEELKAGSSAPILAAGLGDLPRALIRARIARGMSQRELAEALGYKEQQIQRYEASEYSSASLRRLLGIASLLGVDLECEAEAANAEKLRVGESEELDWSMFPIKEMYRRHWFEGFQGSLDAAIRAADTLVGDYVRSVIRRPTLAFHRKHVRAGSQLNEYALLAWESRVLHLSKAAKLRTSYVHGSITPAWLSELVRLSRHDDGPLRAGAALAELGILMVVEPHLPGTHLDGASLLSGDEPIIGLTLRYDRLDNFWFVLLHELAHLERHLRKGKLRVVFDDLDAEGEDRVEQEADSMAAEALLPGRVWDVALARYVRSPESVASLANELEISPAIVAGRIQREANNYVILSDLLGRGQVRKLFTEVEFNA